MDSRKLLGSIIFFALIFLASPLWAATYYVCQSSSGDGSGSSYANCKSVSSFNANALGALDGDTVYLCDTITSQVVIPDGGADEGSRVNIRGDYAGHAGSIDGVNLGSSYAGALQMISKNYITFSYLTVTNTTGTHTTDNHGVLLNGSGHITLDHCAITNNRHDGFWIFGANSTNFILSNSTVSGNGASGLINDAGAGAVTIYNCTFDGNGQSTNPTYCVDNDTGHSFYHNIYLGYDVTGTNYVYNNIIINDACGQGIKIKSSAEVYNNFIGWNEDYGIMHIEYSGVTSTQRAYNNVIIGNEQNQIGFWYEGNGNCTIEDYNNSIYTSDGSRDFGAIAFGGGSVDSYTAKNNIIYTVSNGYCWRTDGSTAPTSATIDYNWCYGPSTNVASWNGSNRTWSQWQGLGFDANGDNSDPKYTAPGSNDLTLQSDSPCIDQGATLAAAYDDALDPSCNDDSCWPDSVVTLDQDLYGSGWEIGAYVYGAAGGATGQATSGGTGQCTSGGTGQMTVE